MKNSLYLCKSSALDCRMIENKVHIAIVNGPNLNLIGKREPSIYGTVSWEEYLQTLRSKYADITLDYYQSNHEGDLIDYLQLADTKTNVAGILLNAGGYTHTGIALRDAVVAIDKPVIEVHISDLNQREAFRQVSYLRDVVKATFMGHGLKGYDMAIDYLLSNCK